MIARSLLGAAFLLAVLGTGALVTVPGPPGARADLVGPRDVERALDALDDDDDARRARAASWLALRGADEMVVPALLRALADEESATTLVAIALAVARRARAEDAPRLLELEPTLRATARAPIVITLAQLGTEETDAWLVSRLAGPISSELRPALEQAAEIARHRRDALLPRVIEALAASPSPALLAWLASLEDERARGALLTLARGPVDARSVALEGLAHLAPSAETAVALRELAAEPGEDAVASAPLARALLAADPSADVSAFLDGGVPAVRAATLDALVRLGPARAMELLGTTPSALRDGDQHVFAVARTHPSLPLAPWLLAEARDASLPETIRDEALEAIVRIPACNVDLAGIDSPVLTLAEARLARVCASRALRAFTDDAAGLHLRAIAGEDVRASIAARFEEAATEERLALAHAWLAGRAPDDAILGALDDEADPEVFAVLAAAAVHHHLESDPRRWLDRLEDRRTRRAALAMVGATAVDASIAPRIRRALARALSDPDPATRAAALGAGRGVVAVTPQACAALEHASLALRRAAWAALPAETICLTRRARVDPDLRAWRAQVRAAPDQGSVAVLRVVASGGGALPRVSIVTDDGRWLVLRPPAHGVVALPGLPGSSARVLLDEEPVAARER